MTRNRMMMQQQRILRSAFIFSFGLAIALFALSGCEHSGPERIVVSGTVAHQGEPISSGLVRFQPIAGSMVPLAWGEIVDGRYKANVHGGVCPGTYQVQFEAYGNPPAKPDPDWMPRNTLPKRFGEGSKVQITIKPGDRNVVKDFDLRD